MLESARDALSARRIRFLVVSTHHQSICGDPRIARALPEPAGRASARTSSPSTPCRESFSGDGLIVASMDPRDRDLRLELSAARASDSLFGELDPISPPGAVDLHPDPPRPLRAARADAREHRAAGDLGRRDRRLRQRVARRHRGDDRALPRAPPARRARLRPQRPRRATGEHHARRRAGSGDWCWLFGSDDIMAEDGIADGAARDRAPPERVRHRSGEGQLQPRHVRPPRAGHAAFLPVRADAETVFDGFETIVHELAFQHAYLSTNVVRRSAGSPRCGAPAPTSSSAIPTGRTSSSSREMARRDPTWVWLPDVLVKARAGRPYLVARGTTPTRSNLARVHAALVDGLRRRLARRSPAPGRRCIARCCARATRSPRTTRSSATSSSSAGQTLRATSCCCAASPARSGSCRSFAAARLPVLLVPAAAGRLRPSRAPRGAPMTRLAPRQIATDVRATLPASLDRARAMTRPLRRDQSRQPRAAPRRRRTPSRSAFAGSVGDGRGRPRSTAASSSARCGRARRSPSTRASTCRGIPATTSCGSRPCRSS